MAARFERAAQRADGCVVGRTGGHVFGLKRVLAHRALHQLPGGPGRVVGPCQVVAPFRPPGQQGRDQQGRSQGNEGRPGQGQGPPQARVRHDGHHDGHHGCQQGGAQAHRVEVIQVRTLELDVLGAPAHGLVDDQIRHQRPDPANGHIAVNAQHALQRTKHAQCHQEHRDQHVEDHPHHPPGMAVREPGKKVGPGQRACIRIGHIDLDLRDDDEQHRGPHGPGGRAKHLTEARQVHLGGLHGLVHRHLALQGQKRQKGPAQHLEHARQHPTRPRHQHGHPPAHPIGAGFLGQEAQKVDLLAHLHDQGKRNRGRHAKGHQVELTAAGAAPGEAREFDIGLGPFDGHHHKGQHQQHGPQRLGPQLQTRDQRDAMGDQRDDHQRRDHITKRQGPAQQHLQGQGHDGRLQCKEDEGEAGVDQRGQCRAQVAKARAAGEQVQVDPVLGGVIADRQRRQENEQPHHQDRPQRIGEAVVQRNRTTNGLQRQKRHRPERRVGHAELRPLAKGARRVAQRVVLQGLVGHPGVVVTSNSENLLAGNGHERAP